MLIARDEDEQLRLFTYKPMRGATSWHYDEGDKVLINGVIL